MIKKLVILTIGLFVLSACNEKKSKSQIELENLHKNDNYYMKMYFFKNDRVDLCFVSSGSYNDRVLTIVPCTDAVLKAIEEDKGYM
jgi:3-polyprenyl-4-hydroxybenzoate decarboxylase